MSYLSNASSLPVSADAVVIGRGRAIKQHPGNLRFMDIVRSYLPSYSSAPTKTQKSHIIMKILKEVRSGDDADFIKLVDGVYHPIEEAAARITIAQTIRDELNENYKSSKQHKQRRRFQQKQASVFQSRQAYPLASVPRTNMDQGYLGVQPLSLSHAPVLRAVSVGSSSTSCSVNSILQEALEQAQIFAISPLEQLTNSGSMPSKPAIVEEETEMDDVFSSLFKAFAPPSPAGQQESPFEPTPLPENTKSSGSLEADWEPLPLMH